MNEDVIAILLAEDDREIQRALIEVSGITAQNILQAATVRLPTKPTAARTLLELCDDLPQATYLLAQTHAQAGAYQTALPLIVQAREQFLAVGKTEQAWRTTVGEMMVLGALGRSADALTAADNALTALDNAATLIRGKLYQNRGLIYEQRGDFSAAMHSYDAASATFERGGHTNEQSDILKNRGVTLLSLGEAAGALRSFERAAELVDESVQPMRRGRTLFNIGYAHMLLGNYSASLEAFQAARSLLAQPEFEQFALMVELDSADLYLALNLTDDALTAYANAQTRLSKIGMAYHAARALFGWGIALCAAGEFTQSAEKLTAAKTAFIALENQSFVQRVIVEQAALQLKQGSRKAALATIETILDDPDLSDQTRFAARLTQADAATEPTIQQAALSEAATIAERLRLPHLRYRVQQRQGQLAVALSEHRQAETYFRAAIDIVETLRGNLQQESLRISFLQDRLTAYRELLGLLLQQERLEEAWQLGEQIKSRTLAEAQRRERSTSTELEIDALRQQLDALYNMLLNEHEATRRVSHANTIRQRILELEKQIEQRQPALIPPQPSVTDFVTDNDTATASITYHLMGEELLAFVQRGAALEIVRDVATQSAVTEAIDAWEAQMRWMRGAQSFLAHRAEQFTRQAQRTLRELYDLVFAPLYALVSDCERLLIVPADILHQLPFHALYDGERYLIEQFTMRYAPSVTVAHLSQKSAPPDYRRVAAFGVDDPALAYVSAELTALTPHFLTTNHFYNKTATRQAVVATTAPVLHFATHGIFRSQHPLFSGLRLYDGWLTAHDVIRLDLDNRLIVLSACESGRAQLVAGDEVLGLPHAFLGAGARSVVASLWLVQDEVSAELMPIFYQHLQQTQNPGRALRNAQLAMLSTRPHPYFWANFVLFGGGVR